jgi:hypothetical protein
MCRVVFGTRLNLTAGVCNGIYRSAAENAEKKQSQVLIPNGFVVFLFDV